MDCIKKIVHIRNSFMRVFKTYYYEDQEYVSFRLSYISFTNFNLQYLLN